MSKEKIKIAGGFIKVPNIILYNENLSLTAKFVYIKMSGLPDTNLYNKTAIRTICKIGIKRLDSCISELLEEDVIREPINYTTRSKYYDFVKFYGDSDFCLVPHKTLKMNSLHINEKMTKIIQDSIDYAPTLQWWLEKTKLSGRQFNNLERSLADLGYKINKKRKMPRQIPLFGADAPIIKKEKIKRKVNPTVAKDPDFEKFYSEYPRKKSKSLARAEWDKLTPVQKDRVFEVLPLWIERCKRIKAKEGTVRFVNYPNTFLSTEIFEDDTDEWEDRKESPNKKVPFVLTESRFDGTQQKF